MELRQLRYFIAVAEELHFTRAAARMHIGQPPLSHAIQMLEDDIGAQLFERTKRSVKLTVAGQLFLQDARRIIALTESARDTAKKAAQGETGELRIGFTFSTPFTSLFSNVIKHYRARYPEVNLSFHEMSTNRQLEQIEKQQLDLGFIRPPDGSTEGNMKFNHLQLSLLRRDPLMVVLPITHALSKKKKLGLKELADESFIMYPHKAGTGIYPQVMRLCQALGFSPKIAHEVGEASTIIGLVASDCGVSILPGSFERLQMDGVCYRPLSDSNATTSLLLARPQGSSNPLIQAFSALALKQAQLKTR
ncbi:MAG: LysR family transcriptional regulator [Undibacterium sp.]|nr:LysR family transcriptional regulator [Undibacterium sp.]